MTAPSHGRRLTIALLDPSNYGRLYDHQLAAAVAARGHDVTLWASPWPYGDAPPANGYRVRDHFYRTANRLPTRARARQIGKAAAHPLGLATMAAQLVR